MQGLDGVISFGALFTLFDIICEYLLTDLGRKILCLYYI